MNIKILYDSEAVSADLASGWGFSCLINDRVLFDTGESAESLKKNIEKLKIDLSLLEAVVISHDHWDHIGGVEYIARKTKNLKIYLCPGFDAAVRNEMLKLPATIVKADQFHGVCHCVYTTGQVTGFYKGRVIAEQALILQSQKGFSVITGCAHPGIIEILKKIRSQLSLQEIHAVVGGFHLKDHSYEEARKVVEAFLSFKVKHVAPLHCTGGQAVSAFQDMYEDKCHILKIGDSMEV